MPDESPEFDHLIYVREDAGRELPGSGLVLSPGVPMPLFGKGAVDGALAVILVARGDCAYCDAQGNTHPADQPMPVAEPQSESRHL